MDKKVLLTALLTYGISFAHHGFATLGAVGIEGPGAPVETSTSQTLPQGSWLFYLKLDHVKWKKYSFKRFPDQQDSYDFWIYGLGYGVKPWLSLYIFVPYYVKKELKSINNDPLLGQYTYTTAGFADISLMGVIGFKYYKGFKLVPKKESLDDLMDWHFTLYGGVSLPTGNANIRDRARDPKGEFEPSMALGFGKPSFTFGMTATKQFISMPALTLLVDSSYLKFLKHKYNTGDTYKFGDEFRVNTALAYRVYTDSKRKLRIDLLTEANYLLLQKDEENGRDVNSSGGQIVYGLAGSRLYFKNISAAFGIKMPVWKKLNNSSEQQGAEGKEKYRLIFTISALF